jgi:hypothetical protein
MSHCRDYQKLSREKHARRLSGSRTGLHHDGFEEHDTSHKQNFLDTPMSFTRINSISDIPFGSGLAFDWITLTLNEGPEKATRGRVNGGQSEFLIGTWSIS